MFHRNHIQLLYLLISCVQALSNNRTEPSIEQCSLQCTAPKLRQGTVYSKWNTSEALKLNCSSEASSLQLQHVSCLDLTDNSLTQVPRGIFPLCKSLTILTLAENSIENIRHGAFEDLRSLRSLNLSFNNLRKWKVRLNHELQSLIELDVTDNKAWLPRKQLLQLKNLTTVRGVTWTEHCKNCLLTRPPVDESEFNSSCSRYNELSSQRGWPWHEQIQHGRALDFVKVGFWPTCLCDELRYIHQFQLPVTREVQYVNLKGTPVLYATGTLAILANMTVVLAILFNRSLRNDTAAILICNAAVCDVILGIFSVIYAIYRVFFMKCSFKEQ